MTIQEAIKSGKRCRRKSDSFGPNFGKIRMDNLNQKIVFEYISCVLTGSLGIMPLILNDILADDWEIEREPSEIWKIKYEDGSLASLDFTSKSECENYILKANARAVKFREVIE